MRKPQISRKRLFSEQSPTFSLSIGAWPPKYPHQNATISVTLRLPSAVITRNWQVHSKLLLCYSPRRLSAHTVKLLKFPTLSILANLKTVGRISKFSSQVVITTSTVWTFQWMTTKSCSVNIQGRKKEILSGKAREKENERAFESGREIDREREREMKEHERKREIEWKNVKETESWRER